MHGNMNVPDDTNADTTNADTTNADTTNADTTNADTTNADTTTDLPRFSGFLNTLNDDIRSTILHMLKNRHLFSTMRTCRALFQQGLPVLLEREHYFHIYPPEYGAKSEKFAHFYNFLCFTAPSGFSSLRSITFGGFGAEDKSQLDMIVDTLRRAENLQQLIFENENLINNNSVAEAVASLVKLQRLSFNSEKVSKTCMILHSLQAPLVYLDASFSCFDPIPLLYNFQHTLEQLHLSHAELIKAPNFSCPKVTRLNISHGRPALLSVLATAFPNLEVLILRSEYGDIDLDHPMDDVIREKNTLFQRQPEWHSLVSLTIDPCGLYMIGLQCQVDSVVLPLPVEVSRDDDVPWLVALLPSLGPQHLQLSLWNDPNNLSDVLWTVRGRLQRLDVTVDISQTPPNVVDIILDAISPLRLKMLYVNFECNTANQPPEQIATAWSIMDSLEPKEIARQAMAVGPSLQYVKLEFQSDRTDDLTYWEISTKDKDAKQLKRVYPLSMISFINRIFMPAQTQNDFYKQENWSWSD